MVFSPKQILFHPGNCLNLKKPYPRECRQCLIFCPHEALSENKNIIHDKCTECGLCMAVCPSDGLVDRDMPRLGRYLFESERIVLNCPLAEPSGYEIACLGMLDRDAWTTLILLAEGKEVRILTGDCGQCDDRAACVVSVAVFKELLQVLPEHPALKIEILPAGKGSPELLANTNNRDKKPTERRISLRQQGKEKLKAILPGLEAEETYATPKTREWLAQALSFNPEKKIPFKAVKASDDCTGCGVCAKICPQGALSQEQKQGKIRLIYEPLKCVQCARCIDICGPKALSFEYINFSSKYLRGKILIIETMARSCLKCGKQIFHKNEPQLCMACAAKDPGLKGILY
ncbi:MAG: 4Fe-4S dicluster domain-containing protein [Desulfitobacteriia bacterium]|jgi:energy-converting hydrogenase B subunit K